MVLLPAAQMVAGRTKTRSADTSTDEKALSEVSDGAFWCQEALSESQTVLFSLKKQRPRCRAVVIGAGKPCRGMGRRFFFG